MLCGGGGQHYLILTDFNIIISFFKSLYNFLSELNNIFHVKGFIRFTFDVKFIDDRRKTSEENFESRKVHFKVKINWMLKKVV